LKKILWFDTETTGLDPNRNGMIQLAMIMDIDSEAVDELQVNMKPFPDDVFQDKEGNQGTTKAKDMLRVVSEFETPTGIKITDIANYQVSESAIYKINAFLQKHISKFDKADKAYIGGYNVPFDIAFLSKFYEKCGDKYLGSYINWKQVDVRSLLYMLSYDDLISLDNFKLETVATHYGFSLEAHNPISDIKITRDIFYHIRSIKGGAKCS
jgi:DNA polymerase-3 subunit epsilon